MRIRTHHFYIGLLLLVTLGAGVFYVLHNKLYPVATVNGNIISGAEFERVALAGLNFYVKTEETAARRQMTADEIAPLYGEIRRATLDKLVGDALIDAELHRRFGDRALALADQKIADAKGESLRAAVPGLYGITYDEFRDIMLLPEAKQELLGDALKGESSDAQSWLAAARRAAHIAIFLPTLGWKNGAVEIKQ